jgi:type VI secretion system secreted protein Hcp
MGLDMLNVSLTVRLVALLLVISLAGCKSGNEPAQSISSYTSAFELVSLSSVLSISEYQVVSSRRVGRTVTEYTLRAVVTNIGATRYTEVAATLTSVPSNMTIVDGSVFFGTVIENDNTTSADEFIITVDLSVPTSLDSLVWQVNGVKPPPPGGGTTPGEAGIFMSIDNNAVIQGEVSSKGHENWIKLLAWSEGSSQSGSLHVGGGGGAGKLNLQDVSITKFIDSASVKMRLAVAEGDVFSEVKIDYIKSCGKNLYTEYAITLSPSMVTSVSSGGSGGEDRLSENVTFNYSRIETMYTPVDSNCRPGKPIYSYQDVNGFTL